MYISEIRIKNFRCFDEEEHIIRLKAGLNVLVGENDSGKSAIIDAIKIVLGTTDQSWYRIETTDFYNENVNSEISIVCKFSGLSEDEFAAFLECITYEDETPYLYLNWKCKYLLNFSSPRITTEITTGKDYNGPAPAAEARELLRATYLRPLRDAYMNMQAGRGSRLSQVLFSVDDLNKGEEYSEGMEDLSKLSLTGIVNLCNKLLAENPQIQTVSEQITKTLSEKMLLAGDAVKTSISVAGSTISEDKKLSSLLEKLDLVTGEHDKGRVGLGTSNILSMACELLLNHDDKSSFLLIEEPEAHIHAQRQLRLIQSLADSTKTGDHQIIITTHSPLLASVVELENITIIKKARTYSLSHEHTMLNESDYAYLERYLDATKANLFFAKSVIIVEGSSEELLLPTVSRLLNKDLTRYGVSIVNARGIGLKRFANIFKRKAEPYLDIPVACITDRDIMPDCAPAICLNEEYKTIEDFPKARHWKIESEIDDIDAFVDEKSKKADGQKVKTFVSDYWTLEYDLAYSGLFEELLEAIAYVKLQNKIAAISETELEDIAKKKQEIIMPFLEETNKNLSDYDSKEQKCSYLYKFFQTVSKPEVAQELSFILERKYKDKGEELRKKLPHYLVDAIEHVTAKG